MRTRPGGMRELLNLPAGEIWRWVMVIYYGVSPKIINLFLLNKVFLSQAAIDKLDDTELNGRRIRLIPERG